MRQFSNFSETSFQNRSTFSCVPHHWVVTKDDSRQGKNPSQIIWYLNQMQHTKSYKFQKDVIF